jgi:hypothetical protein
MSVAQTTSAASPADGMVSRPPPRRWLYLALGLHFLLGGLYRVILPLWGAVPDEPLHYSHIKYVAEFHRFPLITNPRHWGEPLAVYCFTADPCGTAQHGPLYYWSAVPLFYLTQGLTVEQQLYALRAWSLALGALMLPLAWAILRRLFPDDAGLVVTGTLVVALLPHRLLMSAVIYNDIACGAATFLFLWMLLRAAGDEGGERAWLYAGLALGLAFVTKRVALVTVPGAILALILQSRRLNWAPSHALRCLALWVLGFLLIGGWWVAHDFYLYGDLLPAEPGFHRLSWLQLWYSASPSELWTMLTLTLRGLWLSIWSQVGWLPFDAGMMWRAVTFTLYGGLGLLTLLIVVGYFGGLKDRWRGLSAQTRDALASFVLMVAGMVYGAMHFVMLQSFHGNEETGKHAIAIFVCLVALLAAAWRWMLGPRRAVWGMGATACLLAAFNLASIVWLTTSLIPKFRPLTPSLAGERVRDLPSGVAPGIWHRYKVPGAVQRGGEVPRPPQADEPWMVVR